MLDYFKLFTFFYWVNPGLEDTVYEQALLSHSIFQSTTIPAFIEK